MIPIKDYPLYKKTIPRKIIPIKEDYPHQRLSPTKSIPYKDYPLQRLASTETIPYKDFIPYNGYPL